jgi:hypothetical protein
MLGAAVVAGGLGFGAISAQAAQYGIGVREQVDYVPPCPGPGYVWVAGFYNDGYWNPGYWNFVGNVRPGPFVRFEAGPIYGDRDRAWDHDRDRDRGFSNDRVAHRDSDRDNARFRR